MLLLSYPLHLSTSLLIIVSNPLHTLAHTTSAIQPQNQTIRDMIPQTPLPVADSPQMRALSGVQDALKHAQKSVNGIEIEQNIDLEIEDSAEIWENMDSEGSEGSGEHIADKDLEHIIQGLSVEVSMGTDECYRR